MPLIWHICCVIYVVGDWYMLLKRHICQYIFDVKINIYAVLKYVVLSVNMLLWYMLISIAYMPKINNIYVKFVTYIMNDQTTYMVQVNYIYACSIC